MEANRDGMNGKAKRGKKKEKAIKGNIKSNKQKQDMAKNKRVSNMEKSTKRKGKRREFDDIEKSETKKSKAMMTIAEQIETWLDDEAFVAFANERMNKALRQRHRVDSLFEEMDEGFDEEDAYVVPMVEYLSCRLHKAQLCKDKCRREQEIWWVWYEVAMQGYYVQLFMPYYETLVEELRMELMPMIHREYMQRKGKK